MNIEQLPDHPAILDIANALWNTGEIRGAAVMVGAGFSRFANFAAATLVQLSDGDGKDSLSF